MKDPKVLFPFLFITSWIGDLVLIVLACFLAFTHAGPLSPTVFLTIAFCILAGSLLPLGTYLLYLRWNRILLEAEAAEADIRVREALRRAEAVTDRLDEAEGSLAKGILLARQVPDRIEGKFRELESVAGRLEALPLERLLEAGSQADPLSEELAGRFRGLETGLRELDRFCRSLPETIGETKPDAPDGPDSEAGPPLEERLDMLHESVEAIQESLDGLMVQVLARAQAPDSASARASASKGEKKPTADPAPVQDADPQAEMVLEPAPPEPPPETGASDQTRVVAHAMVGMRNALYLRDDGPLLSWDRGIRMDLIGIGEFAWTADNLREPIEAAILLNDDLEAEGGPFTLKPGETLQVSPVFPVTD
jgi:hypothetical protein